MAQDNSRIAIPLARGRGFAYVSPEDVALVGAFKWHRWTAPGVRTSYAMAALSRNGGTRRYVRMHRLIGRAMGLDPSRDVDHENRDGLDNVRTNLRSASKTQNQANRGAQRNSRSGRKGVFWSEDRRRWVAMIQVGGRRRNLGRFETVEAAERVYAAWAREAFGVFAGGLATTSA